MDYGQLETERIHSESSNLDQMSVLEAAELMNKMDSEVAGAVGKELAVIAEVVKAATESFKSGGRLIYAGAGTSGRLGVLDASECVPTFGVSPDMVIGRIAGGDRALRYAVEGAEDDPQLGRKDMEDLNVTGNDLVVAISASGSARYCRGALIYAKEHGATTAGIACVEKPAFESLCDYVISAVVGPEILTGSTRLRAGTATKMILNMISTLSMVQIGKIYKNFMVDVVPSNIKLLDRATRIVMNVCETDRKTAEKYMQMTGGNVETAIVCLETGADAKKAHDALSRTDGFVRKAIELIRSENNNG